MGSSTVNESLAVAIVVDPVPDNSLNLEKYKVKRIQTTKPFPKPLKRQEEWEWSGSEGAGPGVVYALLGALILIVFSGGAFALEIPYAGPILLLIGVAQAILTYRACTTANFINEFPSKALSEVALAQHTKASRPVDLFIKSYPRYCATADLPFDGVLPSWSGRYNFVAAAVHYASPEALKSSLKYGLPIHPYHLFLAIETPIAIGSISSEAAVRSKFVHNRLEIIKYLLAYNNEYIHIHGHDGRTPLVAACGELVGEWVNFFLRMGADPNAEDSLGYSPLCLVLHSAANSTIREEEVKVIVDDLLAHGADPAKRILPLKSMATHKDGPTALEYVKSVRSLRFLVACFGRGKTGNAVFLSHYKRETGSVARLLKTFLQDKDTITVAGKVFLDSDSLDSISMIESQVLESQVLVALLSKNYLDRPYCLIELCTAWKNDIPLVPIMITGAGSDFSHEGDIDVSGEVKNAVENLSSHTRKDVEKAVNELLNTIAVKFEPNSNEATLSTQTGIIVSKVARFLK